MVKAVCILQVFYMLKVKHTKIQLIIIGTLALQSFSPIVYKDNTVDLKRIKFLSELDLSKVRLAIGGVGLEGIHKTHPKFYYSPCNRRDLRLGYNLKGEWKDFTDVLKKRNKSVLGYNKKKLNKYLHVDRSEVLLMVN